MNNYSPFLSLLVKSTCHCMTIIFYSNIAMFTTIFIYTAAIVRGSTGILILILALHIKLSHQIIFHKTHNSFNYYQCFVLYSRVKMYKIILHYLCGVCVYMCICACVCVRILML